MGKERQFDPKRVTYNCEECPYRRICVGASRVRQQRGQHAVEPGTDECKEIKLDPDEIHDSNMKPIGTAEIDEALAVPPEKKPITPHKRPRGTTGDRFMTGVNGSLRRR
jgi:uncharacterized protein (DUF111 family)